MRISAVLALFLLVSASSAFALPGNFSQVIPDVYRGARPWRASDYSDLAEYGVRTVINLEGLFSDEQDKCEENNLECLNFRIFLPPVPGFDKYFDFMMIQKAMRKVIEVTETQHSAVYFHCFHGSDRTGTLAAALVIRSKACHGTYDQNALKKEIVATLRAHGFHENLYSALFATIVSWTTAPPAWICNP